MILNRFLRTLYNKVTVNETGLTDHFIGVFARNSHTFAFYKADYRTLELRATYQPDNGKSPYKVNFRQVRCWTNTYFKIDETVVDSEGSKLKIIGTGWYNTRKNTLLIGLKINNNGVVRCESFDLKKTVEI